MTFTAEQQKRHRDAFIDECHQKAWGAACNADWIGKQMDELMAQYEKLNDEDAAVDAEIKTLKAAPDFHTKDNRDKLKQLDSRLGTIRGIQKPRLSQRVKEAQKAIEGLYASVETNLALAKHAAEWAWREVDAKVPNENDSNAGSDDPSIRGSSSVGV
jgi:hypothetical protein